MRTAAPLCALALAACAAAADPGGDEAEQTPAAGRTTRAAWVRDAIDRWNAGLAPADRAAKYAKMAESPLAFFRGSNHLFWRDNAPLGPDLARYGRAVWIDGDAHLENFGTFDDDGGRVVYGLDDFDDAWIADYQLDLRRLATSVVLFAQERGLAGEVAERAVAALAAGYLDRLRAYRGGDAELDVHFDAGATRGAIADLIHDVGEDGSAAALIDRWTVDGRFDLGNPDLAAASAGERAALLAALGRPARDVARRLGAGLSSLGLRRYYVLLDEDVILDVKEARRPPAASWAGPVPGGSQAEVALAAERALTPDGGARGRVLIVDGLAFLARPLSPWKDDLAKKKLARPDVLVDVAAQWGAILATAHARADEDFDPEAVPGSFDDDVVARVAGDDAGFAALLWARAQAYAGQVTADHAAWAQTR